MLSTLLLASLPALAADGDAGPATWVWVATIAVSVLVNLGVGVALAVLGSWLRSSREEQVQKERQAATERQQQAELLRDTRENFARAADVRRQIAEKVDPVKTELDEVKATLATVREQQVEQGKTLAELRNQNSLILDLLDPSDTLKRRRG